MKRKSKSTIANMGKDMYPIHEYDNWVSQKRLENIGNQSIKPLRLIGIKKIDHIVIPQGQKVSLVLVISNFWYTMLKSN